MRHTVFEPTSLWKRENRAAFLRVLPLFFAVLFLLSCFPALALPPQKFQIAPPSVSTLNSELFLNLSLTVDNEDGLHDLLKDGAVLQLGVSVAMTRKRSWWANVDIAEHEYTSLIYHDPLTRDFVMSFPTREGEKTLRDKNLTRLIFSSWRNLSLPVVPLRTLYNEGSEEEFVISLTISLQHTEVPPWLEKSFVFWSSDVVPQEKFSLPFTLPAAPD